GQWSVRGGIVDVFSPARDRPVRAEFLGDEVESLRVFDPTTQRSVEETDEFDVLPLAAADAASGLVAYLPGEPRVALGDAPEWGAPWEDAPAVEPLSRMLSGFQRVELSLLPGRGVVPRVDMGTRSVGGFSGQFKTLAGEIQRWLVEGFTVRL